MPAEHDEEALRGYIREHHENGEYSVTASMGLQDTEYPEWLSCIRSNAGQGSREWGRSLLLLCIQEGRIVGLLSVRYELPSALSARYGDIGYGVRPSERGKGYATQMLQHALTVCREHGMRSIVAGCYKDNAASAAVLRKCGGVLTAENDHYSEGRISQYYRFYGPAGEPGNDKGEER